MQGGPPTARLGLWKEGNVNLSPRPGGTSRAYARPKSMTEPTQTDATSSKKESFAELFEESIARSEKLREGDIISGTVLKVGRDNIIVDIGFKSEGVIPIHEFVDA